MSAFVSLHDLSGDSIHTGTVRAEDGRVGVSLADGTQLHWKNVADFEAFVDALRSKVMAEADTQQVT
jgi:hypothetical protein